MSEPDSTNIKEEYELWKKNCRYMYDFVSETALTWPSLTVQWLPHMGVGDKQEAKLLLGTHTSGEDKNYVKIGATRLPNGKSASNGGVKVSSVVKITKKFEADSEINRARYMPQDSNIAATIDGDGACHIYHLDESQGMQTFRPHTKNGYGLSWNPHSTGLLLTSSDDKTIAMSNIVRLGTDVLERFTKHSDIVNDVKWHPHDSNVFGSVSDDKRLLIYDHREKNTKVSEYLNPNSDGINCLTFSPYSQNLVAVGNTDSSVNLVDLRNLERLLHTMMGHGDGVTCMEFSPSKDGILATGSQDRRIFVWDLLKIGEEQLQEDAEDGSPEIFMMHAGHTGAITDLSWCPFKDWTIASVADDNIVQLWKINDTLTSSDTIDTADQVLE